MRRYSISQLRSDIRKSQKGTMVYINAIGLSMNAIEELRRMIQEGELYPDLENTKKVYKDIEGVMSGRVILPQNYYKVVKVTY